MKIGLLFFLLFATIGVANAQQALPRHAEHCESLLPYGFPRVVIPESRLICRTAYALLHDDNAKIAPWVAYTLTAEGALGCEPRSNSFSPDQSIPRGRRSEISDYAGSGFDMGHLANSADMSWDRNVARESFILSNMAPQLPALNRGAWRQLEQAIRAWAFSSNHSVTIYTGSVYGASERRIGANGVVVPRAFYKIVVNNATRQSLAFLFPHQDVADFRLVQVPVSLVERETGIYFPVPDDKSLINRIWQINLSAMMSAKRERCRG